MDLEKHKQEFENIIKKYNLSSQEKANEIAIFLTKNEIDIKEFATLFNMDKEDAIIFLSFIQKGIEYKEKHIDKK
jgi:hypothetical protein